MGSLYGAERFAIDHKGRVCPASTDASIFTRWTNGGATTKSSVRSLRAMHVPGGSAGFSS
jgi:hypothetical protein